MTPSGDDHITLCGNVNNRKTSFRHIVAALPQTVTPRENMADLRDRGESPEAGLAKRGAMHRVRSAHIKSGDAFN